jgi:hypothetical protein
MAQRANTPAMAAIHAAYSIEVQKSTITPDDEKQVWKLHFARQITVAEQTTIITFISKHLEAPEMLEIAKLMEGVFDEHILQKLFTRLTSSFATYTPDKSVMDYLHQHSS